MSLVSFGAIKDLSVNAGTEMLKNKLKLFFLVFFQKAILLKGY